MPRLTLTFDNGPTVGITEGVLETLDRFGVLATFFLVGTQLEKPQAVALAHKTRAAGHWVGNHSYSHGEPLGLQRDEGAARREITSAAAMLGDIATTPLLFRPNGRGRVGNHLLSVEAVDVLAAMSATIVLWTSVPKDRKTAVANPDSWLESAKRDALECDWSLIVLHDRPSGHDVSPMTFLPDFLSWTRDQGIEIVQEFPKSCLPMIGGLPQPGLEKYVTRPA